MPATTKSRFGSSYGSGRLGTTWCPFASKCPRKRWRMSADFTRPFSPRGWRRLSGGLPQLAVEAGSLAQLRLALVHGRAHVGGELTDRGGEIGQALTDALRHAAGCHLRGRARDPARDDRTDGHAHDEPEHPAHQA